MYEINLNLLLRQVETDKVRLDRGKITITDLAQSESSLAGAQAQFTQASNDLLISVLNYENIVGNSPDPNKLKKKHTFTDNADKISIKNIKVQHGKIKSICYIINNQCAYASDVSKIYDKDISKLMNLRYFVIDCLRYNYHPSHFNLDNVLD